jgi:acyl-CoA thioester hydrolase
MYFYESKIRVRYGETDRMGFVYYGNYAGYFEVARVETLKSLGVSYKELEDNGIILPVLDYRIKYIKPAYYDDLLLIKTTIPEIPKARIFFSYEIFNEQGLLLNKAETTLVFIDQKTMKPIPAPQMIIDKMKGIS